MNNLIWMAGDAIEKVGLALIFLSVYRAMRAANRPAKSTDLSIEKR